MTALVHRPGVFVGQTAACLSPRMYSSEKESVPACSGPFSDNPEEITCPACRASLYGWWWIEECGEGPYLYCTGCESFQSDGHDADCPYVTDPGNWGAPLAYKNVGPIWDRAIASTPEAQG